MRVEAVDMVEFVRRMEAGIYDPEEFEKAYAWVRELQGRQGLQPAGEAAQPREKDKIWEIWSRWPSSPAT
jgi:L-fucose isomerase